MLILVSSVCGKNTINADRDPCDTDKSCFFYKPRSIWLICLVVLIPGLGWLNLSISFSYQRPNRSTAGHWTKTRVLLLHRKSQRLRTGRGEVYQKSSLQGPVNKAKKTKKQNITMLFYRNSSCRKRCWDEYPSCYGHECVALAHTHTFLTRVLE